MIIRIFYYFIIKIRRRGRRIKIRRRWRRIKIRRTWRRIKIRRRWRGRISCQMDK